MNEWKLLPEEEEFTVMKVKLKGQRDGSPVTVEYNLLDWYDPATQTSSMARTTGYTCTAVVNLLAKGMFTEKGVFPPELLGKEKECFDFVISYLGERGVNWKKSTR
jgi:saccharopine dehydrogenase-like NADP-dependent oxidoreductase